MNRFENLKMINRVMIKVVDGLKPQNTSYGLREEHAHLAACRLQPEAILISKFYTLNS
jgi:hypothetical protein